MFLLVESKNMDWLGFNKLCMRGRGKEGERERAAGDGEVWASGQQDGGA